MPKRGKGRRGGRRAAEATPRVEPARIAAEKKRDVETKKNEVKLLQDSLSSFFTPLGSRRARQPATSTTERESTPRTSSRSHSPGEPGPSWRTSKPSSSTKTEPCPANSEAAKKKKEPKKRGRKPAVREPQPECSRTATTSSDSCPVDPSVSKFYYKGYWFMNCPNGDYNPQSVGPEELIEVIKGMEQVHRQASNWTPYDVNGDTEYEDEPAPAMTNFNNIEEYIQFMYRRPKRKVPIIDGLTREQRKEHRQFQLEFADLLEALGAVHADHCDDDGEPVQQSKQVLTRAEIESVLMLPPRNPPLKKEFPPDSEVMPWERERVNAERKAYEDALAAERAVEEQALAVLPPPIPRDVRDAHGRLKMPTMCALKHSHSDAEGGNEDHGDNNDDDDDAITETFRQKFKKMDLEHDWAMPPWRHMLPPKSPRNHDEDDVSSESSHTTGSEGPKATDRDGTQLRSAKYSKYRSGSERVIYRRLVRRACREHTRLSLRKRRHKPLQVVPRSTRIKTSPPPESPCPETEYLDPKTMFDDLPEWQRDLFVKHFEQLELADVERLQKAAHAKQPIPVNIFTNKFKIPTLYMSRFPQNLTTAGDLFICDTCLGGFLTQKEYVRHCDRCYSVTPPGTEIYHDDAHNLSVFEVDGLRNPTYCRMICDWSRCYIEHKTLHQDFEPFLFYVLTVRTEGDPRNHFVGYFSKQKYGHSTYNLCCLLVLPCYQGKGYGRFLVDFSYLLSRCEGIPGTPERPLSEAADRLYYKYALDSYFEVIYRMWQEQDRNPDREEDDEINVPIHINTLEERTGICAKDLIGVLRNEGLLVAENENDPKKMVITYLCPVEAVVEHIRHEMANPNRIWIHDTELKWSPKFNTAEELIHFPLIDEPAVNSRTPKREPGRPGRKPKRGRIPKVQQTVIPRGLTNEEYAARNPWPELSRSATNTQKDHPYMTFPVTRPKKKPKKRPTVSGRRRKPRKPASPVKPAPMGTRTVEEDVKAMFGESESDEPEAPPSPPRRKKQPVRKETKQRPATTATTVCREQPERRRGRHSSTESDSDSDHPGTTHRKTQPRSKLKRPSPAKAEKVEKAPTADSGQRASCTTMVVSPRVRPPKVRKQNHSSDDDFQHVRVRIRGSSLESSSSSGDDHPALRSTRKRSARVQQPDVVDPAAPSPDSPLPVLAKANSPLAEQHSDGASPPPQLAQRPATPNHEPYVGDGFPMHVDEPQHYEGSPHNVGPGGMPKLVRTTPLPQPLEHDDDDDDDALPPQLSPNYMHDVQMQSSEDDAFPPPLQDPNHDAPPQLHKNDSLPPPMPEPAVCSVPVLEQAPPPDASAGSVTAVRSDPMPSTSQPVSSTRRESLEAASVGNLWQGEPVYSNHAVGSQQSQRLPPSVHTQQPLSQSSSHQMTPQGTQPGSTQMMDYQLQQSQPPMHQGTPLQPPQHQLEYPSVPVPAEAPKATEPELKPVKPKAKKKKKETAAPTQPATSTQLPKYPHPYGTPAGSFAFDYMALQQMQPYYGSSGYAQSPYNQTAMAQPFYGNWTAPNPSAMNAYMQYPGFANQPMPNKLLPQYPAAAAMTAFGVMPNPAAAAAAAGGGPAIGMTGNQAMMASNWQRQGLDGGDGRVGPAAAPPPHTNPATFYSNYYNPYTT